VAGLRPGPLALAPGGDRGRGGPAAGGGGQGLDRPRLNQGAAARRRFAHLVGPVLEIGSGIGNISAFLLAGGCEAWLSDLRPHYCRKLRERFGGHSSCKGVLELDLVRPGFERAYGHLRARFGTVFALNVVEHIADDHRAIANCHLLLRPGGRLIVLVPAYRFLYNRFDRELGHYRRYTRATLRRLLQANGLDILGAHYFNLAGVLGWFVSGTLLKNHTLPAGQVALYNRLVWLFRILDRLMLRRLGLSVLAVGRTREGACMPAAA
jgi:SAM-dependent methyltransferase